MFGLQEEKKLLVHDKSGGSILQEIGFSKLQL